MLTHKHIAVTSLVVMIVLASLMLIPSVKATIIAEMPPYEDEWTLAAGNNSGAYADLSSGHLQVFLYPFTTEGASAHAKVWKRVWLPAGDLEISYSWKLKGYLMCGFYFSWTGIHLYIFVEESLNSGTIHETTLFEKYVDWVFEYQESIDKPWQFPDPIVVSIPEAGYYNVGAALAGRAGGLLASCAFVGEEEGGWVSMSISGEPYTLLSISASSGGTTDPAPGTYTYDYGESVTVTASAYSHYYFDHWVLDGVGCGSDPTITVTMDSDHNLKAYFTFYNNAPDTPSLTGPTSGYVGWSYTYKACATDPDGDSVKYTFYWDDDTATSTGYYGSGVEVSRSHSWSSTGTYIVAVMATDVYGRWKCSSSLTVAIYSVPGGCPTLLVWNGSDYVDYGVIDIHDVENDVVREVHVQAEDVSVAGHKVKFTLREGWEGLNYSHSLIDQVKLYAVDSEGNRYLCPLMKAEHSEQGKVLLKLLFSDDYRIDTYLMDTIDLAFKVPYPAETIENFTFIIEGHNPWKM